LEGWVNQSGPDAAPNWGLVGPFTYSIGYSTTTGVTNGSYSLACSTTNSDPGNSAVIINTTPSVATEMSTALSISLDILPIESGSAPVYASIYFNGLDFPYSLLSSSANPQSTSVQLTPNQQNTATFAITAAQRAMIVETLGANGWFQVGINIQASNPITVYFDNFTGNYPSAPPAPTPTPTPTPVAGADVAVSGISDAGTSFTYSAAPYSLNLISMATQAKAPAASSMPVSQTVATGRTAVFTFGATGTPAPTYQWYLNGVAIPSATHPTLVVAGAISANAGSYTCVATNASGSVTSAPASLTVVSTPDPGRLANLSARALVGTGGNIIFGGFATGGAGTSGAQSLLIRASGPALALAPFSVPGTLPDPQLQLYDSLGKPMAGDLNEGWGGSAQISAAASQNGAFAWSNPSSHDSALLLALQPGTYSAEVAGQGGDTGVALVEIYDATPAGAYALSTTRLINLSARVDVQKGAANALFVGFAIKGTTAMTVLIRASGPALALAPFSVPGTLPDPQLQLYDTNGKPIAGDFNSGWGGDPEISGTARSVGAFPWSAPASNDSALLLTLPPGTYSAVVSGTSGDAGVVLVEVYEVP
jgi:hypothetical protein